MSSGLERRLAGRGPIVQAGPGTWFVTDIELGLKVLRHPALAVNDPNGVRSSRFIMMNSPDHERVRSVVNPYFTKRAMSTFGEAVREIGLALMEEFTERKVGDVTTFFAIPLATRSICALLAIPRGDHERIAALSGTLGRGIDRMSPAEEVEQVSAADLEMNRYAEQFLQSAAGGDIVPALRSAFSDGKISMQEAVRTISLLLVGGIATSASLLTHLFLFVARNGEVLEELRRNPEIGERAVEKCVEESSPVRTSIPRIALEATWLTDDVLVPQGGRVIVLVGLANQRSAGNGKAGMQHIAFGAGRHSCIGGHLARLEANAVLGILRDRVVGIELLDGPVFHETMALREISQLVVRVLQRS